MAVKISPASSAAPSHTIPAKLILGVLSMLCLPLEYAKADRNLEYQADPRGYERDYRSDIAMSTRADAERKKLDAP